MEASASKDMIITRACLALQDSFALRISDSFSEHPYVPDTGAIKGKNASLCFQGPPRMGWDEIGNK